MFRKILIIFFLTAAILLFVPKKVFAACPASMIPTNLAPNGAISAGANNITWSPVSGANQYLLRIHDLSAGAWQCVTGGTEVCTGTSSTSYPYNFQLNHSYFIWLHTDSDCGVSDPASVSITVPNLASNTPPEYTPVNPTYYYIAPNGSDSGSGSISNPFLTLSHARDVIRNVSQNVQGDIVVYIRGGYYPLNTPLIFTPVDSGKNGHFIIYKNYPGEVPLISGGINVTGWQISSGGIWKAYVGTGITSRELYVNGVRKTRARTDGPPTGLAITTTGFTTNDARVSTYTNASDIEIVDRLPGWQEGRCGVQSISGTTITMKQPCFSYMPNLFNYASYSPISWMENAYEFLDKPGEWYLNRSTGWLYYIPETGVDMTKASVILPTLESIVSGNGTASSPISNLRFEGLVFAYATWLGPNQDLGFVNSQASFYIGGHIPGNIRFDYVKNVHFDHNIFIHLGGDGLSLGNGSQNNFIVGNYFGDISGTALSLGNVDMPHATGMDVTQDNQILDNFVTNAASEYSGSVGIWDGYTNHTTIAHNEVTNLPYTGISVGWGWGTVDPSVAQNNIIEHNNIYNVMLGFADGAGLYSLGAQPGNVYSENLIHDIHQLVTNPYKGTSGITLDDGSRYITVYNNMVYNTDQIVAAKGTDNTITANGITGPEVSAAAGIENNYLSIKNLPAFPTPSSSTPSTLPGDLNNDGHVNLDDFTILKTNFGNPYTIFDLNNLVANYGK